MLRRVPCDAQRVIGSRGRRSTPGAVYRNVQLGIGFVPQGHNVFKNLSVERNLRIAGLSCTTTISLPV